MKRLTFRRFVDKDVDAAATWYDGEQSGLGVEFIQELDESLVRLADAPESFPLVGRGYRVCRLHRFEYGIYFRITHDSIVIIGVIHLHRDDAAWKSRI